MNNESSLTPAIDLENHPWLAKEAGNDKELFGLILAREALFDQGLQDGTIDIHDPAMRAKMDELKGQIEDRKHQLGIDPHIQP
jgi:hypothetical protein